MSETKTRNKILNIARELLASGGLGAISFDAIARRLGHSKQAVLYWFPTKHDLLAAMFLPSLEAEAEVAIQSVANVANQNEAISAFVRAVAAFHIGDLNRFRMMYLLPQTIRPTRHDVANKKMLEKVHPVTDEIYDALSAHLDGDIVAARRKAAVVHSAVLGLVLMFSLADGLKDPLKHTQNELVDALIASLAEA